MQSQYGHDFYADRHRKTADAARNILAIVASALPPIDAAIDFGCGVGTWLSVLRERGAGDVLGLDGPWVERALLQIPPDRFQEANFEQPIALQRRYDLAITLEVAEHVSPPLAGRFVDTLTAASDFVLFSAAVPHQGGVGHVNEQWPDYWAALFSERGYEPLDFVRRRIWGDDTIPYWYRQNLLVFARRERLGDVHIDGNDSRGSGSRVNALIHPELYLAKVEEMSSLKGSWRLLRHALRREFQRGFRGH